MYGSAAGVSKTECPARNASRPAPGGTSRFRWCESVAGVCRNPVDSLCRPHVFSVVGLPTPTRGGVFFARFDKALTQLPQ